MNQDVNSNSCTRTNTLFDNQPLTKQELCDYLRASESTIDQYNREGMPRFYVGKECRYIASEVLEWLKRRSQHRVNPTEATFDPDRRNLCG